MKLASTFVVLLASCFVLASGRGWGQDELARAQQALKDALDQKQDLEDAISGEEASLILQFEKLEEQVATLTRELRVLESEESLATRNKSQLDRELEGRGVEFDFLFGSFSQYARDLTNRLHVAESQVYEDRISELERTVEAADGDFVAMLEANLPLIELGTTRLLDLAGGHRFAGDAAGPGNTLEKGNFALVGPIGFFSSPTGEVAGVTSFTAGDVRIPEILAMKGSKERGAIQQLVNDGAATVPVDPTLGKAFQIAGSKKTLGQFLEAGGFVGYVIIGLGFVAAAIALFKLIEILRFAVPSRRAVNIIIDHLLAGREQDALEYAAGLKGLAGRVVEAGARHFYAKRRILEDALFEKISAVQPRLDRLLPFLAVVAAAAPMAGLLGTVLGIMKTFDMMAQFGTGDAKYFSQGIGEALVTTFLGLTVAIPTIMVHGILKSLSRARLGQVEGIALAMINGTTEIPKAGIPSPDLPPDEPGDDDDGEEGLEDTVLEPEPEPA